MTTKFQISLFFLKSFFWIFFLSVLIVRLSHKVQRGIFKKQGNNVKNKVANWVLMKSKELCSLIFCFAQRAKKYKDSYLCSFQKQLIFEFSKNIQKNLVLNPFNGQFFTGSNTEKNEIPKRPEKQKKLVDLPGVVTHNLSNGLFRVKLENGVKVIGHLSGKIRQNRIKIVVGDNVIVELSPYDLTKGRITYRHR